MLEEHSGFQWPIETLYEVFFVKKSISKFFSCRVNDEFCVAFFSEIMFEYENVWKFDYYIYFYLIR